MSDDAFGDALAARAAQASADSDPYGDALARRAQGQSFEASTPPKEVTPAFTQIKHAGLDFAGGLAHGIGTLADVATGTYPGAGSHAEAWSRWAQHEPDYTGEEKDPKVLAAQNTPKVDPYNALPQGPFQDEMRARIPQATEAISMIAPGMRGGVGEASTSVEAAQAAMNRAASGKSMGAASSAANIMGASPELQQGIVSKVQKTGGAVNPEVLQRHLEADSLPVKMQLTEGQATQDPSIISNEMNMRGKHQELADHYNSQNGQLIENLRTIRERAGPDVFTSNPVDHGQTLIDAYKAKGAAADADISAKYKALKDANGGQFPVDAEKLQANATSALHDQLLFDHAPKAVMNTLGRLADSNNMTFENYEALRTNLARIQRSSTDGNERAAAGVIRSSMENLPLNDGAGKLKPIADEARGAAKAQFSALDSDPAYKAAVNDAVSPDQFVGKFITGRGASASKEQVATMRKNLADNDTAKQTMGVAALDSLRDAARVDVMGNGNFAAQGFNKQLDSIRPKLGDLIDPEHAEHLDTLGKVSRYTTSQPKGSFVNNSNTLVGGIAHSAGNVIEHAIPYGNVALKVGKAVTDRNAVKQALAPAAGIDRLKTVP